MIKVSTITKNLLPKTPSVARPSWKDFKPVLTKNQKASARRKEIRKLCDEALASHKVKYVFIQKNSMTAEEMAGRTILSTPKSNTKALSRFVD